MPGWVLSRDDIRNPYRILRQDNGLVTTFDRAGRLVSTETEYGAQTITVDYPHDTFSGPQALV
jgi:hypothetical protein